jgi:hypothetical protein
MVKVFLHSEFQPFVLPNKKKKPIFFIFFIFQTALQIKGFPKKILNQFFLNCKLNLKIKNKKSLKIFCVEHHRKEYSKVLRYT